MGLPVPHEEVREPAWIPVTAILVVAIDEIPREVGPGWAQGPLPVPLPRRMFPKFLYADTADQATREQFLAPRVHGLLYGSASDPVRRHIRFEGGDPRLPAGWRATALEVLAYPTAGPAGGLLAIHAELDGAAEGAAAAVAALANLRPRAAGEPGPGSTREAVEALVSAVLPGSALRNKRIGYVVSHVVFADGPPEGLVAGSEADPALQWSRVLALANEPSAMPGELRQAGRQSCDIELSATWETCVLKNGASFVGLKPAGSDPFHHLAKALVHSTYLDAILLGLLQRDCVDDLSNSISDLWQAGTLAARSSFEKRMVRFRSEAWWSDISETAAVNRLLKALHDAYDLSERQDRLHADIQDVSRVLAGERADRTNRLLNILLVISIAFGVAALVADPGLLALLLGLFLGAAAWAGLEWFERRHERDARR